MQGLVTECFRLLSWLTVWWQAFVKRRRAEEKAGDDAFLLCKSFRCKILISNSFGFKVLRGDIFSAVEI